VRERVPLDEGVGEVLPELDAEPEGVGVVLEVVCRDAITTLGIQDDTFDVLGTDLHTLARIDWPDGSSQFAFAAESRALSLPEKKMLRETLRAVVSEPACAAAPVLAGDGFPPDIDE
jgi:hypothetical protein